MTRHRWIRLLLWSTLLGLSGLLGRAPAQTPQESEPAAEALVLVVKIEGEIGVRTVYMVQSALREALSTGARFVILDIDTPGGLIVSTKEIEGLIHRLQEHEVQVYAWVRHQAKSAGAYIALACDKLFMAPGSSIGAIQPVMIGPGGVVEMPDNYRRKLVSSMRANVRALLESRPGISKGLLKVAEAMVDREMVMFEVTYEDENGFQQAPEFIEQSELQALEQRNVKIVRREALGPGPLTLTASEAERYGFSSGTISSIEELVREELHEPWESVMYREETWSEGAVAWLDSMKPILFVLGFVLLLIELKTPGFAVPGALGALLLALAMFGSYLVGLAEWTEILLFFLGIGLIAVEIFVLPGMLIFGLVGILCMVFGLVLSQQSFFIPATVAQEDILLGNLTNMLMLTVVVIVGAVTMWKLTPHIPVFNRILQAAPTTTGAAIHLGQQAESSESARARLVGLVGVTMTDLRPSGVVEADGERYDAVADGSFVARDTRVRVVAVQYNQVVVEAIEDAEAGEIDVGVLILLWALGLCFVIAEVFFPSMGILSILAALAFVSAIFLAYTQHSMMAGHITLVTAAVAVPIVVYYTLKILPNTPIGRVFLLKGPGRDFVAGAAQQPGIERYLNKRGSALSSLRPSGLARIEGERVDVITRGEMIDAGSPLQVIEVEGNRVVVSLDRSEAQEQPS